MNPSRPAAPRISAALLALALATPAVVPALADSPREDRRGIALLQDASDDDSDDADDADSCEVSEDEVTSAPFCAGEVIVRLARGATVDDLSGKWDAVGIDSIQATNTHLITVPADRIDQEREFIQDLASDNDVAWAELNFVGNAPQGNPSRFFPRGRDAGFDPEPATAADVAGGYGAGRIGANRLRCVNGKGVTVAVIDTGIDAAHPSLAGKITKPWNAFTGASGPAAVRDVGNGTDDDPGADFDENGNPVILIDEAVGHGTHVAGIVLRAAPRATVMPVKALDSDGAGQAFYLASAIAYATSAGADVINLSLGSEGDSRAVREAVAAAVKRKVVVVAAAGNAGTDAVPEYPAALPGVIAVGATDAADAPAAFSSRYGAVDVSAPGVDIASAFPAGAQGLATPYATWSGTSMAAPWVSAAAALMLDQQPRLAPAKIARKLAASADPITPSATGMGKGRLDVGDAISCKKGKKGKKGKKRNR